MQIAGIDPAPVVRQGDVSAGGLFIAIERDIGPLGSMQRLVLFDEPAGRDVVVLARVVRVATVDDFWKGTTITGVAFQFLFEEVSTVGGPQSFPANQSPGIARLLRGLAERAAGREGIAVAGWRGTVDAGSGPRSIALRDVNVRGMVLETDHALGAGLTIRVELAGRAPEAPVVFQGEVIECSEESEGAGGRYRARVAFRDETASERGAEAADDEEPPPSGIGETLTAAFSSLLDAVSMASADEPPPKPRVAHLSGNLQRVSLVSVLTLCQLEQVTGVLELRGGRGEVTRVHLRGGEILDVEDDSAATPRAALGKAMRYATGTFDVSFEDVNRPRRVEESTTALVLDLAREMDEHRR